MPMLIIYFQNLVDLDTDTDSKWVVGWNGNSECGSQDELSCCYNTQFGIFRQRTSSIKEIIGDNR